MDFSKDLLKFLEFLSKQEKGACLITLLDEYISQRENNNTKISLSYAIDSFFDMVNIAINDLRQNSHILISSHTLNANLQRMAIYPHIL